MSALSDEEVRFAHMRDTAIGRLQAARAIHEEATSICMSAIRAAYSAGASKEQIRIESGLTMQTINRVIKGGKL